MSLLDSLLCELYVHLLCPFFSGIADLFLLDYRSPSYIIEVYDFFLGLLFVFKLLLFFFSCGNV